MAGALELSQKTLASEALAQQPGLWQSLHPAAQVLAVLGLLLAVGLSRNLLLLAGLGLVGLALGWASRVSLRLLAAVTVGAALLAGILALPALFNWVRPGAPLWFVHHFGPPGSDAVVLLFWRVPAELWVTRQGLLGAAFLAGRAGVSALLAAGLVAASGVPAFLEALRMLRVPELFVSVLALAYRYIFILLAVAQELLVARQARTVGRMPRKLAFPFFFSALGTLWLRSWLLSEEVFQAMLARGGVPGQFRAPRACAPRWKLRDWAALAGAVLAVILAVAPARAG